MISILLYYCCMNSKNGTIDKDICDKLSEEEQRIILKFCEVLSDMEATINNVYSAIAAAYEAEQLPEEVERNTSLQENSYLITGSSAKVFSDVTSKANNRRKPILKFKSSITVLPSVITDTTQSQPSFESFSDVSDFNIAYTTIKRDRMIISSDSKDAIEVQAKKDQNNSNEFKTEVSDHRCQPDCACTRCSFTGPCCGDPGCSKDLCDDINEPTNKKCFFINWKCYAIIFSVFILLLITVFSTVPFWIKKNDTKKLKIVLLREEESQEIPDWAWQCRNHFCRKVFRPSSNKSMYSSLNRCILLCSGPQLWPYPIGYAYFSKTLVALATSKLEYKFQSIPSDAVQQYLAEAFKLFLKDLLKLEKIGMKSKERSQDLIVKKMVIQVDVESDPDPRLRLNTEESYMLKAETNNNEIVIKITSVSFCGVRHGLETLSQVILSDQSTGYLITLSDIIIKDAPSYKYRGLMLDTGRNFIPVIDLMRTIDAMATCKLNTFHWRISDVTSFSLHLAKVPEFYEYGPYDREMVYTKEDIKSIVKRAGIRGIRILIEVAAPGPVGRPWSWSSAASCPRRNANFSCNILCLRLNMQESVFDILQAIYSEILEMTNVDDVFHLSDGVFSFTSCNYLLDDRKGFLDKALVRLKIANKGFLPKLPIVWYTPHLRRDFEANTWDRFGVQLNDWDLNPSEQYLRKFKVIQSTNWDLSCETEKKRCIKYRSWQQIYAWKSWRNVEAFTIEGGESILWTDIVDSSNLDYHLWPRAAAVAERLWSDMVANSSADKFVYMRLDTHRWRMLLRGVKVQPLWPAWCSFNPSMCLDKVH